MFLRSNGGLVTWVGVGCRSIAHGSQVIVGPARASGKGTAGMRTCMPTLCQECKRRPLYTARIKPGDTGRLLHSYTGYTTTPCTVPTDAPHHHHQRPAAPPLPPPRGPARGRGRRSKVEGLSLVRQQPTRDLLLHAPRQVRCRPGRLQQLAAAAVGGGACRRPPEHGALLMLGRWWWRAAGLQ